MTDDNKLDKIFQSIILGAPRTVLTFGIGHPFDFIKTFMQASPVSVSSFSVAQQVYQNRGVAGFYAGGTMNFSRSLLKEAYRTPLRGYLKKAYSDMLGERNTAALNGGLISVTMMCADNIIILPLERLKVLLMTSRQKEGEIKRFFFNRATKEPILKDLFRGFVVSMTRSGIAWGSYLIPEAVIREKVYASRANIPFINTDAEPGTTIQEKFLIGGLSGLINGLCTLPFDTLKTNVQKEGFIEKATLKNMYNIGAQRIKDNGVWRGLYPAFSVRLFHYAIVGVITADLMRRVDGIWESNAPSSRPTK